MGRIVYCHCAFADVLPKEVRDAVLHGLREAGVNFEFVPDLCELAARQDPRLKQFVEDGPLKIAACYPRAVKWLFHAAGTEISGGEDEFQVLNMREQPAEEVLGALLQEEAAQPVTADCRHPEPGIPAVVSQPSWKPWFPVVDYERCTNCLQCLSFCLFDVYGMDGENRIQVQNPQNCKTNCPACSRVCPEVAIMFPKYAAGPINGAPVSEREASREKFKVDISALLGGDIYANLRERSATAKSRFSVERSPDQALNERRKCLAKLQGQAGIPPGLLAGVDLNSLPSPEEIQQRARQAAARAEAARKAIETGKAERGTRNPEP